MTSARKGDGGFLKFVTYLQILLFPIVAGGGVGRS